MLPCTIFTCGVHVHFVVVSTPAQWSFILWIALILRFSPLSRFSRRGKKAFKNPLGRKRLRVLMSPRACTFCYSAPVSPCWPRHGFLRCPRRNSELKKNTDGIFRAPLVQWSCFLCIFVKTCGKLNFKVASGFSTVWPKFSGVISGVKKVMKCMVLSCRFSRLLASENHPISHLAFFSSLAILNKLKNSPKWKITWAGMRIRMPRNSGHLDYFMWT